MKITGEALTNATASNAVKKLVNSVPQEAKPAAKDRDGDNDNESRETAQAQNRENGGSGINVTA